MAHLKDLLVAGPSRFIGEVAFNDNVTFNNSVTLNETLILAKNPQDAEGTQEGYPALIIGDNGNAGAHLAIDGNEIMAKSSATAVGSLYLNNNGGLVTIGVGGLTTTGIVSATQGSAASSTTTGALRVTGGLSTTAASWIGGGLLTIKSSSDASSSAITLWRGTNASWKIENASGTLHFSCNYTTSVQSTYTSLFSIAYNTGVIQTKGTINLSNGTTYYINGSGSSKLTNLSLAGTLGVTGATTLSSTLGVTGATTLKSTLGVSGVATFANTVKITQGSAASSTSTGALQITGGLSASANSYFGADVTVVKNLTAKTLTISDTSGIAHLIFSRGSYNYIHAKTAGGVIAFVVNGQTVGSATSEMVIQDGIINPGTTNVTDLGSTSLRWKGIYANTANFGGNLTVSGTATITKSVTINDGTASTSKTTGALKVSGGIGATGQVNAQSFRIDNAVKFVYNSTDKCVDVIFE